MKITGERVTRYIKGTAVGANVRYQALRTAWRVGLAIRYVISRHLNRISGIIVMRRVQHTKHLLLPRPLYGSKLFRDLLFQVLF